MAFELRKEDDRENEAITQFQIVGCQCPNKCWQNYSRHYYESQRCQCAELSHELLDMAIMGQLMSFGRHDARIKHYLHLGEKVKLITS